MNGKTHSAIALVTMVAVGATCFPKMDLGFIQVLPLVGIPMAALGGLAADIDKKETTMGQRHPWISKMFRSHRGITHTPLVCAGLFALMMLFSGEAFVLSILASLLFGFVIGYWTHVFIDVFNGAGIPHLWPIVWKRMHMMSVVTGTSEEKIFLAVYMLLAAVHVVCIYGGITL